MDSVRALALLSDAVFPGLIVEVHYEEGYPPSREAMDHMMTNLETFTGKASIRLVGPLEFPAQSPSDGVWSFEELDQLRRSLYASGPCCPLAVGDDGILVVVYVGGFHEEPIAGYQQAGTIFVFQPNVRGVDPLPVGEGHRNTLLHEVGHALGLVNNGIEMQTPRMSAQSPAHSTNPDSVMFEGYDNFTLENGPDRTERPFRVARFDDDDRADMRVFRENMAIRAREDPESFHAWIALARAP